jgi:DNA-binding transcriptional regulator YdaS (Cro superfamily)
MHMKELLEMRPERWAELLTSICASQVHVASQRTLSQHLDCTD